jgi:flagellar biosynthetic protein FliO
MIKVVGALALVIGLIFLLRYLARRFLSLPGSGGAGSVMSIIARTQLGPRQQLVLIKVGKRLVMASQTPTQMTPLSEISDPDEIEHILATVAPNRADSISRRFDAVIGKEEKKFTEEPGEQVLLPGDREESDDPDDPALSSTRQELTGLKHKIKDLARQFKA